MESSKNSGRVLIFDTHPVQYRAPIYATMDQSCGSDFEVIYISDTSVRGYLDKGFGRSVAWNTPLLEGYQHRFLEPGKDVDLSKFMGLKSAKIGKTLDEVRPKAIILHSLNYIFCYLVVMHAKIRGIPLWLRMETQDEGFVRSPLKSTLRSAFYRGLYPMFEKSFVFGELNRQHFLKHGFKAHQLIDAKFSTVDATVGLTNDEKSLRRSTLRDHLGIHQDSLVVSFFGKLIEKKNPKLLLQACREFQKSQTRKVTCLFVGSGTLDSELKVMASEAGDLQVIFSGFVNQLEILDYYLATDIVCLPSRRQGEVWGLVVNEALHAGCAVIMSDAVGAYAEFGQWERCQVFASEDLGQLTAGLAKLANFARDFNWAQSSMHAYSTEAAASAICAEIRGA